MFCSKSTVLLTCLASIGLLNCTANAADVDRELFVVYWNVENLFDTIDDPNVEGDEEFTPGTAKGWTKERLTIKLRNLARVLKDANDGRGPDVLGLGEIENRDTVEQLLVHLRPLGREYKIIHQDSPSGRGIDCAIVYDAKRVTLLEHHFHAVSALKTREIVEGKFRFESCEFHLFANHWPSKGNPQSARVAAATVLRARIDKILASDESAEMVVIGDLNETPSEPAVSKTLRTWGDAKSLHPNVLFNSTWKMHMDEKAGTYVYKNKWEVIDHVILSPGLVDEKGLRWKSDSTQTLMNEYQMFHPQTGIPRPSRSYSRNSFHDDGFSDHLPIRCILELVD
jgi:predicted extracellular nuclease